jgi:hypothetical protein
MKRFLLVLFVVYSLGASAQIPNLKWLNEIHFKVISMVADEEDNIYIAGDMNDTLFIDNDTLLSNHGDVFLAKIDSTGNFLWYKHIGGSDFDNTVDIRLGENNEVFLLTIFDYTTTIEGDSIPYSLIGHRPLLVKYSTDGDFLWWKIPGYADHGCFHGRMLRCDHENNLIMMSDISYTDNVIFADSILSDSLGYTHISKYNSDGVFQWVRAFNDDIFQVTTDISNNVIILKKTDTNSITDLIKLSPEGNLLWKKQISHRVLGIYGSPLYVWLSLLESDRFNNFYLATWFDTITIGNNTFTANGSDDILLIKYDSTGNALWGIPSGGPYSDYPTSLFIKDDKILMTGSFRKKIYFTQDSIIGYGTTNYFSKNGGFIVEYDLNGGNESVKKVYSPHECNTTLVTKGKSIYLYGNASDSTYFGNYLFIPTPSQCYNGFSYLARFYDEPTPPEPIVDDFEIYPNPTRGTVNFNFNPSYGEVTLQIYDLRGALVKTYTLSNTYNSLDFDFLSHGLYLARLISAAKVQCAKFEKL